ncbi:MAG: hypothetical protein LKF82_03415 [Acinetobacter populi]|jgi:hypothetical protein|uniref:AtuA-related protein n=1 Tax=Acinetobacter populi TaxID=1582270 RepID=UPI002355ABFA|nr:hypothetical protein [Acinetobacter populi]MCH4246878.1 hypothetical protein [Acinetobacter populi]
MKLRKIAHSRTGDKGDTSNISVIAFESKDYDFLCSTLTTQVIHQQLQPALKHFAVDEVKIERYELAQIAALNFVIRGILKGGVTRSLSLDAHGKSLCSVILNIDLPEYEGKGI